MAEKVDKLESSVSILTKKLDNLITKKPKLKRSVETRLLYPVLVTDLKTGESTEYSSGRSAADALGISPSIIRNRLSGKFTKAYKGIYEFKQSAETRLKKLVASPTIHPVLVTDLKTGEITKYPSVRSAAGALGISPSIIRNRLSGRITKAYKGIYEFKLAD